MFWAFVILILIIIAVVIINGFGYWGAKKRNDIIEFFATDSHKCIECKHCSVDENGRFSETGYFCALSKCDNITEDTERKCFEKPKVIEKDIEEISSWNVLNDDGIQYLRQNLLGKSMTFTEVEEYLKELLTSHAEFKRNNDHPNIPPAVLNSNNYDKYRDTWFLIYSEEEKGAITNFDFKVDCLLESLNTNSEIELNSYYIIKSIEENLPYFCEDEDEYDKVAYSEYDKCALCDSIKGLLDIMFYYSHMKNNNCKLSFWKERLVFLARSNNRNAQAALCCSRGYTQMVFSPDEINSFSQIYLNKLYDDANNGDCEAKLAIGEHISEYMSEESFNLMKEAAQAGLSDAWYTLGEYFKSYPCFDSNTKQYKPCSDEERKIATKNQFKCLLHGADANNGSLAALCQYWIGDCYMCGDVELGFQHDLLKARHYLSLAKQNCNPLNKRLIYSINSDLERIQTV